MADIKILVGAKGGTSASGASASLIKGQLEKALSSGIKINVGVDTKKVTKSLQTQLHQIAGNLSINVGIGASGPKAKAAATVPFTDWAGATVSTKEMTQATAALTREKLKGLSASTGEKLAAQKAIDTAKIETAQSVARTQKIKEETMARKAAEQATKQQTTASSTFSKAISSAASAQASFNQYLQNVKPAALKQYSVEIDTIQAKLKAALGGGEHAKGIFDEAHNDIKNLKANFKTMGAEGGNVFTYLEGKVKTFGVYLASSAFTMAFVSGFKNAVSTVKDLNEALVDLRIITGESNTQARELLLTYNALAQELGSTTKDVAAGAQDWLRQGYSLEDTNELLKQSMALSIMGDMSSGDATTSLTAALKGYRLEVSQASDVVDKFFAVDMAAATSSSKLAEALAKTAANAKLAGLDLNDVIGQLAVVNETMQESGEETGAFYNTMLSRMGALKSGRLSDPEDGESLSDVETTLISLGIELRKSDSEFRNFGEVIDEVSGKWDSFSSVQQRAVATAFAGTRQQTRFLSLMSGFGEAAKYSEEAASSMGVSTQKMEIYQEGLEAKANRITSAFEKMSTSLIPEDVIGLLYDVGAGILNAVSALDAWPARIIAISVSLVSLAAAFRALKASSLGASFLKTFKDLGWPETTGDRFIIVPSCVKEAA